MKKEQGYTLIETMVAVMMIITLSAAGLYGWQSFQAHQRLWQTAWQVRDYLSLLRDDANGHNRDHIISAMTEGGRWCLLSSVNALAGCRVDNPFALQPQWPEVKLTNITPSLRFYGLRNTAWAGHVQLQSPAGEWQIVVSSWGRIRLCQRTSTAACL
nr:prepilin peptidase-dependent protein [uncultured Enterobacter sp.]